MHTSQGHTDVVFPIVAETNARQGFLTDQQYEKMRDALPKYLKPLFIIGYCTGVRLGELLAIEFEQIDWEQGFITLKADETKTGHFACSPHSRWRHAHLAGMVAGSCRWKHARFS